VDLVVLVDQQNLQNQQHLVVPVVLVVLFLVDLVVLVDQQNLQNQQHLVVPVDLVVPVVQ
jgi:hypothetical protein